MTKLKWICAAWILAVSLTTQSYADDEALYNKLQEISVTVKSGFSEGSGTIITRDVRTGPDKVEKINFVWTAAHVVSDLRSVRTVIVNGSPKKIIEFGDAKIVKELVENGRRVGEWKMEAIVLKYSDSEDGEDLALLMVRKRNFIQSNAIFYEGDDPVSIGTELYHIGSLLGQIGSNSMTRGIISQVGRVLDLGNSGGVVFDQTTVTAFPGSSGGGVFLSERSGDNAGQYVGMLVRGAGETFNFIVPVRRMRSWAAKEKIMWAIDTKEDIPTLKEIMSLSREGNDVLNETDARSYTRHSILFPTLPTVTVETKAELRSLSSPSQSGQPASANIQKR